MTIPSPTAFACLLAFCAAGIFPSTAGADIPGACCFPDGTCEAYVNSVSCVDDGGTFAGFGVTCDNAGCAATAPECNRSLVLSACPQTIIFETRDVDGVEFELSNLPAADGCDVIVTIEPPLGARLPVGVTLAVVTANDMSGEVETCEFTVVVDLVDEVGPIEKRRIKGGGSTFADDGVCTDQSPLLGGGACGTCPLPGFLGMLVGMTAFQRQGRRCRRSLSKAA